MVSWEFEERAIKNGFKAIAGVDEAGRGPLAGPVVAASCILPQNFPLEGIDDSKKLSPKKRAALFEELITHVTYGVGIVDAERIDEINILQATFEAMCIAAEQVSPDYLLVDGNLLPKTAIPATAVVKGDSRSFSIAAASIIAKETRDRLMVEYHEKWPEYRFDKHKGYGTKLHREMIGLYGLCPIHRRTFNEEGRTVILTSSVKQRGSPSM